MNKNALHDPVWFTPPDGSSRVLLKDSPSPPPAPDYRGAAEETAAGNLANTQLATRANRANQYSPYGSSTWTQADPSDPNSQWSQHINLSDTGSSLLNSLNKSQLGMADLQQGATDNVRATMGTPFNYSGPQIQSSVEGSTYQGSVAQPDVQRGVAQTGVQGTVPTSALQRSVSNPGVQTYFDTAGRQQQQLADVGGPQRGLNFNGAPTLPGVNDFGRERDQVTNALLSRSEPQFARDEELTRTRLLNQGLATGSQASNYDLDTLNRARNDARMQATLAGSQEQSRLFGLASQARNQYTGEQAQQGQFANNAQNQAFSQGLAGGQFANQAQQAQYGQNLGAMQAGNAARAQEFAQGLGAGNFANQAAMNEYTQNLGAGQFANQAAAQQFAQNLGAGQFANQAAAQQFGQGLAAGQFSNQAADRQFSQGLAQANFGNTAAQQALAQQMALYNQPLNTLSAIRSGSQVTNPQFPTYVQQQATPGANMSGAVGQQGQWDQGLYNQGVGQANSFNSGLMSIAGTALGGPIGGAIGSYVGRNWNG